MTAEVTAAAAAAYREGLCVLPAAADGSKRPGVREWRSFQTARPAPTDLAALFKFAGGEGLGIVTGAVSGDVEMFEFDNPNTEREFRALAADSGNGDLIALLDAGYSERTPGGGLHWLYRTAEPVAGNTKLASAVCCLEPKGAHPAAAGHPYATTTLIETRGEGGWVVLAPSGGKVHPSGRPYTLEAGGFATIPTLTEDQHAILWALARVLDQVPALEVLAPAPPAGYTEPTGDRPGDLFNAAAEWATILEPHGWRLLYRHGREGYWLHPDAPQGSRKHDATTDAHDHPYFYVFSTSAAPFEPDRGYDKMGVYAHLNHAGDMAAAARAIAEMPEYGGGFDPGPLVAGTRLPTVDASEVATIEPVEDAPAALGLAVAPASGPAFEYAGVFPADHFVTRWIAYCTGLTDAAAEFHEAAALTILATFTPGVRAALTPWPNGLPTTLYAMLIGPPGTSRKSTAMGLAGAAVRDAAAQALMPGSTSPEALLERLAAKGPIGTLWVQDEIGKALAAWGGRNNASGDRMISNLLQAYAGDQMVYARVKKKGADGAMQEDGANIERPHMSILSGSTPAIFDSPSMAARISDGMIPRFAVVYGHTRPPRMPLTMRTPQDDTTRAGLIASLVALDRWTRERDTAVKFAPRALEILSDYQAEMDAASDSSPILGRIATMAIKVAILSACGGAETPRTTSIEVVASDAESAVTLCRRWADNALTFAERAAVGFDPDTERANMVLTWIKRHGGRVKRSDAMRALHLSAKVMRDVGDTLTEQGQITRETLKGSSGPAAEVWALWGEALAA